MPCRSYCPTCLLDEPKHRRGCPETKGSKDERIDFLTEYLCNACEILYQHDLLRGALAESWYQKHCDAEKPRVRKEALAKLTPKERRALGLDK